MIGTNSWWKNGIIYQIYPRSFSDSNQDGVGDLNGIRARLDYLAWLGVDAIWLSPIYPSANVDFGYDITNHCAIDPLFGTLQEFDQFVSEAHQHNIHIVMDLVLAHTSDLHPWFQQARIDRDNPFHDYYIWADPKSENRPPNNWQSIMGGKYWQFEPLCQQYFGHMFYPQQPDLNWHHPQVQTEMLKIFHFWLEREVDGFRLDVFSSYFKDCRLRNQPFTLGRRPFEMQQHIFDHNQPELDDALRSIRKLVDSYPNRYLVGEPFLPSVESSARYVQPDMLHAAFHLKFNELPWNPNRMLESVQSWESTLGPEAWPCHVLNNHDVPRSSARFHCGEQDQRLKVAAAMLLTLKGTPYLYYGEEIGQRDIHLSRSQILDPVGRRYWPIFKGRDSARAPMQWDKTQYSGFSTTKPWLPVHPEYHDRNVANQQSDPHSLLNWYRNLISLRRAHPALNVGLFQPITYQSKKLLAYLRQTEFETILVVLNFSHKPTYFHIGSELLKAGWQLLISSDPERTDASFDYGKLLLSGDEAILLIQENVK
jgi:alpha-glucosidase